MYPAPSVSGIALLAAALRGVSTRVLSPTRAPFYKPLPPDSERQLGLVRTLSLPVSVLFSTIFAAREVLDLSPPPPDPPQRG